MLTACDADQKGSETAQYKVTLPSGKQLQLCGHHTRQYGISLLANGAKVEFIDPMAIYLSVDPTEVKSPQFRTYPIPN